MVGECAWRPRRRLATVVLSVLMSINTPTAHGIDCAGTATGLVPLIDLGSNEYEGQPDGLYPGGSNEIPTQYLKSGLEQAQAIAPRDSDGASDPHGRIGLVSIGVSNTRAEFGRFIELAQSNKRLNPALVIVNGAKGSRALDEWAIGPDANPRRNLDEDFQRWGLSAPQVQVAWIKAPDRTRGAVSIDDLSLENERLSAVLDTMAGKFLNLALAFLSSRIYAGYGDADTEEPKAHQHGFTVKSLVEDYIGGGAIGGRNEQTLDRVGAVSVGRRDTSAKRRAGMSAATSKTVRSTHR
ncbi:MAG: hypothetical protein LC739_04930, partial [Actinobacteria bacterium]|nr:hypothetical protein [Actinomycetota bacterium]